jgi:hypothetical protein
MGGHNFFLWSLQCYGNLEQRHRTPRVFRKQYLLAGRGSVDSHPKAEPGEQRDLTLYTLASRLQRQKARFNPYMVICNFIGYFTPGAM